MKKSIMLLLAVMLCLSLVPTVTGDTETKILIDESRVYALEEEVMELFVEEMISEMMALSQSIPGLSSSDMEEAFDQLLKIFDPGYSFNNYLEPWGFGNVRSELKDIGSVTIKDSGTLTYTTLRNYDVLILASFEESYSSSEIDAIRQFVENGGGLFVLGDIYSQNNSVSHAFDVVFYSEEGFIADKKAEKYTGDIHQFYVSDMTAHPITKGITQIALNGAIPIQSIGKGTSLIQTSSSSWLDRAGSGFGVQDGVEEEGPFTIMAAHTGIGLGRAVFFGGTMSFWNGLMYDIDQQNEELFVNAVRWLSEPGGPYKQTSTMREQAKAYFSNGKSLFFNSHDFEAAKERFEQAIDLFEQSHAIYSWNDTTDRIEEAQSYIEKCETGLQADDIFETAEDLYAQRAYEDAITEYQNAQSLYEEIEYTDKVSECTEKIEESTQWITLREEATSALQEAEDSLATAPSSLSPSGYQNSKSLYEKAQSAWEAYDNAEKVVLCEEKIQFCQQEIDNIEQTRMIVIVVVIIIVAGAVIVFIIRRKKSAGESSTVTTIEEEPGEKAESTSKET